MLARQRKYKHNRAGIRQVALSSDDVRRMIARKTAQVEGHAQAMMGLEARLSIGGKRRGRGYVSRLSAAEEAADGILGMAIRQARE